MRQSVLILIAAVFVFGCAKNRDVEALRVAKKENVLPKAAFLVGKSIGKNKNSRAQWLTKMTVVETSDSPSGSGMFIGFQGDVKIGYFDFTEKTLQFKTVSGLQQGKETTNIKNPVLLSWDIDHLDYALDERDGQTTNKEIESDFQKKLDRKYFRIKWSGSTFNDAQLLPSSSFAKYACWQVVARERVANTMKVEKDHIGFNVRVVYQQDPACAGYNQWNKGDFNFTVTYKYSFKRDLPSAYRPKYFLNEQAKERYKYGHFQTIRQILYKKGMNGLPDFDKPEYAHLPKPDGRPINVFMENRWAEKTHKFYFVKGFPQQHKWMWDHTKDHTVLGQTNKLLESLGSKLRFEVYDYNHEGAEREFGDLRYSFINFIEELEAGGTPLGYGPSDTHPFTGEIIAANTMVWTGYLGYYIELMQTVSDQSGIVSNLLAEMDTLLRGDDPLYPGSLNGYLTSWDQKQSIGKVFKHMAQHTRYGFPAWNGFTSEGASGILKIPTVLDKHDGFVGDTGVSDPFLPGSITGHGAEVTYLAEDKVPFDFETRVLKDNRKAFKVIDPLATMDLSWLSDIAKGSDPSIAGLLKRTGMKDFVKLLNNIEKFSNPNYIGKEDGLKSIAQAHYSSEKHKMEMNRLGHCIMDFDEAAGGLAAAVQTGKLNLKEDSVREDFLNTVLFRVSIHEFGHNLNLRHNFYGSVDEENFTLNKKAHKWSNNVRVLDKAGKEITVSYTPKDDKGSPLDEVKVFEQRKQISSSVMDYLRLEDEVNTPWAWEEYDMAAIADSYAPRGFDDKGHLYLFCTDEHTLGSALCNRHDLGTTPSQILMSQIRAYDERYLTTNQRFGRAHWNTRGYGQRTFSTMLSMKEFLPMWRTAFASDIVRKEMGDNLGIKNKFEQDKYAEQMDREMRAVMKLTMAFYSSVIQQSRGSRDYRSVYDETTGALKQIGIASDKIFAMYFLAGNDALYYNPNRYMVNTSFLTYSNEPGVRSISDRIYRNILTDRNIAMDPWFIGYSRFLYAKTATDSSNWNSASLIDNIKLVKVDNARDMFSQYGVKMKQDQQSEQIRLPKSETTEFAAGDEVVIIHIDGAYYMADIRKSPATYTLFQGALASIEGTSDESLQRFNLDILELNWLYRAAKAQSLQ